MDLYVTQDTQASVDSVSISRSGNDITLNITTTNTSDSKPRVDSFTLDYALLSSRPDFNECTQWGIGYNPNYSQSIAQANVPQDAASQVGTPLFIIYNTFRETFPTKGKGGTLTARRDNVNIVAALYVPFKNSTLDQCSFLAICADTTKVTADSTFSAPIVPATRLSVRDLVFPSIRLVSTTPVGADIDFTLQLCKGAQDIQNTAELFISCDIGSVSSARPRTSANGQVTVRVYGDPHQSGQSGTLNVGFPYWSGLLYVSYTIP